jgi:putative oxidoreductase
VTAGGLYRAVVADPDAMIRGQRHLARVTALTGVIFVLAGLVKFIFHHWELHAFRSFGLPWPAVLEIVAGALETVGGVLLIMRRFTAPVAALLAVTMIVAVASSGIGHGDVIPSLTLAPALLVATLYILARGLASPGCAERRGAGSR